MQSDYHLKKLRILCKLSLEVKEILNKIQELSNE